MKRHIAFASVAMTILVSSGAAAQSFDHQQCFKIKDTASKAKYVATLTPGDAAFAASVGCKIKVPAKFLCIGSNKSAVTPTPPGAPAGADASTYLCYKTKCKKTAKVPWTGTDQFGTRSVTALKTGLYCAPATESATACANNADCPGTNDDCQSQVCSEGTCSTDFTAAGTPTQTQTSANCQRNECNGVGGVVSNPDDTDVPADDGNDCTAESCVAGVPTHVPVADASECTGGLCFAGVCVPL